MDSKTVQRNALCRSWRELSNACLLAKFGFDTAENEPSLSLPYAKNRWRDAKLELASADPWSLPAHLHAFRFSGVCLVKHLKQKCVLQLAHTWVASKDAG